MDAGAASRAFFRSSPTLPRSASRHRLALAGGQPRAHLRLRHQHRLPQQLCCRPLPLPADPRPPHRCRPSRRHHLRGRARCRRRRGVQQLSPSPSPRAHGTGAWAATSARRRWWSPPRASARSASSTPSRWDTTTG